MWELNTVKISLVLGTNELGFPPPPFYEISKPISHWNKTNPVNKDQRIINKDHLDVKPIPVISIHRGIRKNMGVFQKWHVQFVKPRHSFICCIYPTQELRELFILHAPPFYSHTNHLG